MKIYPTQTGKIYVDTDKKLEFLTVGDYGKENNIKANFLGFTKEINGVEHKDVNLEEKWVATISTQKGCPMKCAFCDCPKFGFYGNASREDLTYEIETILKNEDTKKTDRFNVHFARMGEPTFNKNVLDFAEFDLRDLVQKHIYAKTIHPVVSTMLPKANKNLEHFILEWCRIKNEVYDGEAGLQFSINTTDEEQRNDQFNGMSLSLKEISDLAKKLPNPKGRKYTLNFAVTADTILDAEKLDKLFDKEKFIVKITPIHETKSAVENGYDVSTTYEDYDVYREFEQPLLDLGWDVIVFVPSKEEDEDRITCGNAIIAAECLDKQEAVYDIYPHFIKTYKKLLQTLAKKHYGYPLRFDLEWLDNHPEIDMDYDEWMSWPSDKDSDEYLLRKQANKECSKRWTEVLEEMILLLNEMDEETCSMDNPYKEQWFSYHDEFNRKYENKDVLKTKEELEYEKKTGTFIHIGPDRDPEFGEDFKEVSKLFLDFEDKIYEYRVECKNEFFELFSEYFFDLWD